VVVIAVVLVVALSGGGGGSAQDTAEDFIAAAKAHDCQKAYDLISEDLQKKEGSCKDSPDNVVPPAGQDIKWGAVNVSDESDSHATATVDATFGEQTVTVHLALVKEDGEWKVDNLS
jgi:hypothetical protein